MFISPPSSKYFENNNNGKDNGRRTRGVLNMQLQRVDFGDLNFIATPNEQFSFKKNNSPRSRERMRNSILVLNKLKKEKKKKFLSYLRIDLRSLKTDDSSSLLITDEFKKEEREVVATLR
jgi:hypothetical protein